MATPESSFASDPIAFITKHYDQVMSYADPRVINWPLMESPLIPFTFMMTYFFIVWAGPKIMANRKPVSLGHWLTAYNFLLVALSSYMTYELFMSAFLAGYSLGCQPVDYSNDYLALRMARVCWLYYFSKYIEVADTIFFILRKKSKQVTFLHVYHHGTMIINWWMVCSFVPGGASYFHAMLNSFVHVVMYAYYGLSACGPAIQPYLWWKKYVTKIQMTQFALVLAHSAYIVMCCEFPKVFSYLAVFYAVSMIVLFSNFYYQEFVRRAARRNSKSVQRKNIQQQQEEGNDNKSSIGHSGKNGFSTVVEKNGNYQNGARLRHDTRRKNVNV